MRKHRYEYGVSQPSREVTRTGVVQCAEVIGGKAQAKNEASRRIKGWGGDWIVVRREVGEWERVK